VFVYLFQSDPATIGERADSHNIARELANHVAARNPGGQHEALALGIGLLDSARHMKQVSSG
jgi:hypothetical protein